MSRIFMYAHGGSENHGCEAIVRSTYDMLDDLCQDTMYLVSSNPEEDIKYGLNKLCKIERDVQPYSKISPSFIHAYMSLKLKNDYIPLDKLRYRKTIALVEKNDIALSIGGDNYCYADVNKYIMLHDMMISRGAKTVLWGCSVEPDLLNNIDIVNDLKRYQLITARESITYHALKKINPNTILVSDPAFALPKKEVPLPAGWKEGNMVGINVSPLVLQSANDGEIIYKAYQNLICEILTSTDCGIALIPHVVWENNNDLAILARLYTEFKDTGRILLVEDHDCMKLKGYISQCRFFVGARTHATIAAYSTCVPTLVLGYSVKSKGIAKDLFGTDKNYVIPVQKVKDSDTLKNHFIWIMEQERTIREHLAKIMPEYIEKSFTARNHLKRLHLRGDSTCPD